jgi:hypothetical protein
MLSPELFRLSVHNRQATLKLLLVAGRPFWPQGAQFVCQLGQSLGVSFQIT